MNPCQSHRPLFMERLQRLTKTADFQRVRREGRSGGNRWLAAYGLPNDTGITRFGFAVGKRLGNAVVRNRVRRRLREIARRAVRGTPTGWDIVISARQQAGEASYQQLQSAFCQALGRMGVAAEDAST